MKDDRCAEEVWYTEDEDAQKRIVIEKKKAM